MQRARVLVVIVSGVLVACSLVDPIGALDDAFDATADAGDASDASFDCAPPPGQNPCANVTNPVDFGCYCGTSTQHGFDPDAAVRACLYDCHDAGIKRTVYCVGGCMINAADAADTCVGGGSCF